MIAANITIYHPLLMDLVSQSGVPFLAVEFRPAPEVDLFVFPRPDEFEN